MGYGNPGVSSLRRLRAERRGGLTVIYTVMVSILLLIVVQFVLLVVALEDFLSGSRTVLSGAAVASGACFAATCWLIGYVTPKRAS
ncbi:MAG TPA: DUF6755 family protein [Planctomycetota bacterium]|nr:DUF6755 family protein [Planctomycetota bacterium]